MRITLEIDDDILAAAAELAAAERSSVGAAISQPARRGLTSARVEPADSVPVVRVPITPEMVRRALHGD